ncbi:nitroreductase family protein [bacterium]|nr:nitroreductase family protein [bacterium]
MNETLSLINNRKSLRAYDSAPLEREKIDTIIKSAMRAPTAGNMMMYSIIEITQQETKDKLSQTCDNQPFIAKAPLVLLFLADMQRWYDFYTYSKVPEYCDQHGLKLETPQESDLMLACCDALIAAQTAVIAAESIGIGSCYIGDIMENFEIHKELFKLPDFTFPITLVCFGKYKPSYLTQKPRPRFDQQYIHFKDRYQRISEDGFGKMYAHLENEDPSAYLKDAVNYGQHNYLRKTGAAYSEEMRRSVKAAIKSWKKAKPCD